MDFTLWENIILDAVAARRQDMFGDEVVERSEIPGGPYLRVYATKRIGIEIVHRVDDRTKVTTIPWGDLGIEYVTFSDWSKEERT